MTAIKHTPGPWRYEKPDDYETNERYELWAEDGTGLGESHWEHNARLMSLSPELLEACRFALTLLQRIQSDTKAPGLMRAATSPVVSYLTEKINKATGE